MKSADRRELYVIVLFALLATLPILFLTRNLIFRLDSDYDMLLPTFYFLEDIFLNPGKFLFWNPFIGTGVPNLGDLGSALWSPFYVIPIIFFGVEGGMKCMIVLAVVLAGLSMWILLRSLRVSSLVRVWGSCMYAVSGVVGASIATGHFSKLFGYSLVPLCIAVSIPRNIFVKHILIAASVCALILYTTDFYIPYFLLLFFVVIRAYYAVQNKKEWIRFIGSLLLFCLFVVVLFSPKLFFIIRDVLPRFERYYVSDPFVGSIHAFLLPLLYSMPLQVSFYERPFVQRLIGFQFNWYEYYAFISPLPFIALFYIKSILKKDETKLFLILIGVGALYIALKYPYSPFYWIFQLIPTLHVFRVPSRITTPLTSVVIALFALGMYEWHRRTKTKPVLFYFVLYGSIVWSFAAMQAATLHAFEKPRLTEESVVKELRRMDSSDYYVASFACCMQTFLIKEHIPIVNFYYAWRTHDTPNFLNAAENGYGYDVLRSVRPKYIIAYTKDSFEQYNYTIEFTKGTITVWRTDSSTIEPKL